MRPLFTFALAATVCGGLTAQSLIIPSTVGATTEGSSSTGYPWNRGSSQIRVQYIYDSANFASVTAPIIITGIRFRADDAGTTTSGNGGTYANCEVRLGAAGVDYAAQSRTYAQNFAGGVEPAPAYSGPVTMTPWTGNGTGVPGDWYVAITLASNVLYDPTTGDDFIVDVVNPGIWSATTSDDYNTDVQSTGSTCNRVYNLSDATNPVASSGPFSSGLVCDLIYTPATGIFASFTADKATAGPGETVSFTDTSYSSDPGGITSWAWDFDGNPATIESTVQNPTWAFTGCGPQNVTLTVTDAAGSDTVTRNAVVDIQTPVSSFTADATSGVVPLVVNFTDTSTNNPTAWDWDFTGDGVPDATTQNAAWGFGTGGVYDVTLTTSNACGQGTTATLTILAVSAPPLYNEGDVSSFGTGCPSASPMTLAIPSVPVDNGNLTFNLTSVPTPTAGAAILLGAGTFDVPLDVVGATGCSLLVDSFVDLPVTLTNTGTESFAISPLVGMPSNLGAPLHAQGAAISLGVNPFGAVFSNRVSFTVSSDVSGVMAPTQPGIVAKFEGNDTFSPSTGPFFSFYNNSTTGETIQTLIVSFEDGGPSVAGISEFDVDGLTSSTYGSFEAGNSMVIDPLGCTTMNTYGGTDVTTGLVYPGTDPASCGSALGATTGWIGSNFDAFNNPRTVRFDFTSFGVGDAFQFNADIDGGPIGADGLNEALVIIETDQRTVAAQLVVVPGSSPDRAVQAW